MRVSSPRPCRTTSTQDNDDRTVGVDNDSSVSQESDSNDDSSVDSVDSLDQPSNLEGSQSQSDMSGVGMDGGPLQLAQSTVHTGVGVLGGAAGAGGRRRGVAAAE